MQNHFRNWLIKAPLALTTIGLGASLLGASINSKGRGETFSTWFVKGTISLIVLNAGISLFGDAVKDRVHYELGGRGSRVKSEAST